MRDGDDDDDDNNDNDDNQDDDQQNSFCGPYHKSYTLSIKTLYLRR